MKKILETAVYIRWFKKLKDHEARRRISVRIERLRGDNFGDVRPVGQGISELRIDYGPGYRVYLTQRGPVLIVLLCGGDKSTQADDIAKAKAIADDLKE